MQKDETTTQEPPARAGWSQAEGTDLSMEPRLEVPMKKTKNLIARQVHDRSGQGLTEYLILLVLIAVMSIGAVTQLGKIIRKRIDEAKEQITSGIPLGN